jgi:hypothetical protein
MARAIDARLASMDVQGILLDGMVNASNSGSGRVSYNLSSAGRDAAGRELARVSPKPSFCNLRLIVEHGSVKVILSRGAYDAPIEADLAFKCSFEAMLRLWRSKGLPLRESYYVRLDRRLRPEGKGPAAEWASKDWALQTIDPQTCQPM